MVACAASVLPQAPVEQPDAAQAGTSSGRTVSWSFLAAWPLLPACARSVSAFISAIIYFVIFVAVVYFLIVVPYKHVQARRGQTVFGDPAPVKTCPYCLSTDLPAAASKCKYCGTDQPAVTAG